jgi:addiction module HigA family antidote
VTADTALRLSWYFGISADFWMNLQSAYELDLARQQNGKAIERILRRA